MHPGFKLNISHLKKEEEKVFFFNLSGNLSLIQANTRLPDDITKLRVNSNPARPRKPKAPIPLILQPTLRLLGKSSTSYFSLSATHSRKRKQKQNKKQNITPPHAGTNPAVEGRHEVP